MDLLDKGDPAAIINGEGASPIVLVCEHASRHIPFMLNNLGLGEKDGISHIAWDIGAEDVARRLSKLLDAPLVVQKYSRLVYDCNRPPESAGAMPVKSEATEIPGNQNISDQQRRARIEQIYLPFHAAISALLDEREKMDALPVFVTIHSFTPTFHGKIRDVELGILHDEDARLADVMLERAPGSYISKRNDPYGPDDGVTHTLNMHGGARGLANVMLEVRNDLIANEAGQEVWAERLAALLQANLPLTESL